MFWRLPVMDTLTHTVLGACLGEAIAGKELGKKAMVIGAIANNLPDADVIAYLWSSPSQALLVHRGITHSILAALVFSPLLAWYCHSLFKKYPVTFKKWLLLIGSGIFIHIIADAFTSYGTGWFEPFSNIRVTFNTFFIIDPLFSLPLLFSGIALIFMRTNSAKRLKYARNALLISGLYLSMAIITKCFVNTRVQRELTMQNIPYRDYMATPTPLNNLLWFVVANNDSVNFTGYYSVFDGDSPIDFLAVPKRNSLLDLPCDTSAARNLKRFSNGYYSLHKEKDQVVFSDLRFGQAGGWYRSDAPFVFNFILEEKCTDPTALQKGRIESMGAQALKKLFERIIKKP